MMTTEATTDGQAVSAADWCYVLSIFPTIFVVFVAIVPIFGYLMPTSGIFGVLPVFVGVHPITSTMALLLAISLFLPMNRLWSRRVALALAGATFLLAIGKFVPGLAGVYSLGDGSTKTAMNTALVFMMLAFARAGLETARPARGQFMALLSLTVLFAALIGYIFDDAGLYGHMSLATVMMSGGLVVALLCRRANKGLMASVMAMGAFRIDLTVSVLGPILIGWTLVTYADYGAYAQAISVVVAHIVGLNIILQVIGMRRSHIIERKRRALEDQRLWDMVTDEVTGIYNRASLRARFAELTEEARQARSALTVIVLDLDGFSAVNSVGGYEHGDEALRRVAQGVLPHLRGEDCFGRAHADEFLVFLPGLRATQVATLARQLCQVIEKLEIKTGQGVLTASAGVARWHFSESSKQVYERALAALELARIRGGNQVCVAPGPDGGHAVWSAVQEVPVETWPEQLDKAASLQAMQKAACPPSGPISGLAPDHAGSPISGPISGLPKGGATQVGLSMFERPMEGLVTGLSKAAKLSK
ncbi:GGDEF domain-containing protein [Thioclava sp. GXIMD4216]|uniref:GGDEF domain-containing protein n=1 Tax=Thioclava sp. GXIMD4216 TaxID=3131929 RepID=UPI0030D05C9A